MTTTAVAPLVPWADCNASVDFFCEIWKMDVLANGKYSNSLHALRIPPNCYRLSRQGWIVWLMRRNEAMWFRKSFTIQFPLRIVIPREQQLVLIGSHSRFIFIIDNNQPHSVEMVNCIPLFSTSRGWSQKHRQWVIRYSLILTSCQKLI